MPCSIQQDLMSGSLGALAVLTGLANPGVRVSERTAFDGKLVPWMFLAVTVTSYIVKGTKFSTTTLLVPLVTWLMDKIISSTVMCFQQET